MLELQYLLMVTLLKKVVFSIKEQFHLEKEQFGAENMRTACWTDLNRFPDSPYFLCHQKRLGKLSYHHLAKKIMYVIFPILATIF